MTTQDQSAAAAAVSAADIEQVLVERTGMDPEVLDGQHHLPLVDLGVDSLAVLELQAVSEKEYGVSLPDDLLEMSTNEVAATIRESAAPAEVGARTSNSVYVDAPLDLVWDMTNDLDHWTELFTEYAAVEILERSENSYTFRLTMFPDANGTSWSWVSERVLDLENLVVDAKRVETGPFEFMYIHWAYAREGTGTRMTWSQHFHMKETAPVDDEWMTNNINKNTGVQQGIIRDKIEAAARAQEQEAA